MKLQIGMKVRIKNDVAEYGHSAGEIKTITKNLPDFSGRRAFELDNDDSGIWLIMDFSENISYPKLSME